MSFLVKEEYKLDVNVMWLQLAELKYHLELPGVVEKTTWIIP